MSSGSGLPDPSALGRALRDALGLDDERRTERLAFFELGSEDATVLHALRPILEACVDANVEEFYAHLLAFQPLRQVLESEPGRIEKLRGLQRAYFLGLTDGRFDSDYFDSRLRVGNAHQTIGLRPVWYIGAFAKYLRLALRTVVDAAGHGHDLLPPIEALIKTVFLDMSLAMNTYIYGGFVSREVATELERSAQVAQQALEAQAETERLKDDLASMIVHDLKNPVNGISMMVQLALRKGADLPEAQRGYLQQILQTCREMTRLIQNLLELSKIEEGKMPVTEEPVVLAEMVDEVVIEYRPVASQGGREIDVEVPTGLPPALADRGLLRRVMINLLVNALRHSGSAAIRVVGVPGPAPGQVTLSVIDYGHGIPPAQQVQIFEKFSTVRRSPSDVPSTDTGLGLPFCKLAVERMGGSIALSSGPGETTFAVTLKAQAG